MLRRAENKVFLGLALAVAVIAGIGAIFYSGTALLIRDADRVDHTHAVINTLSDLYTQIQDVRMATRGYVVSKEKRFLERYNAALTRAQDDVQALRALEATDEHVQEHFPQLERLLKEKLDKTNRLITLRNSGGLIAAVLQIRQQLDEDLDGELRRLVNHMIEDQRQRLTDRAGEAQASSRRMRIVLAAGCAAEVCLAFAATIAIRRHMRERRKAAEALQQSESVLRSFFDSGVIMMGVVELRGSEVFNLSVNPATARSVGKTVQEMCGRTMSQIGFLPDVCKLWADHYRRCAQARTPVQFEYFHEHPGAASRWLSCIVSPIPVPPGAAPRFSYAVNDITERRQAEEELRRHHTDLLAAKNAIEQQAQVLASNSQQLETAKHSADAANHAKSTFLANMSHEIRTPLTAILGYAELLLEPDQSASDRQDCLQVIRRSARHLMELINDILDLSKIEAGRMTIESIPTNPAQLIAETVSMIRPRAEEKKVALKLEFDGPLPEKITTDPLRLRQILMNLLGNAVKFTSDGDVIVRVRCDRDPFTGSGTLAIQVVDTGIGMTRDQLDRIFRPFTQADETTTRRFGGTGLGLTISKRLTEMLGGTISAESDPGCGSQFSVTIAAGDLSTAHWIHGLTEETFTEVAARPAVGAEATLRGHILLAEDGRDNQRLIATHLRRAGANVMVAETGAAAIKLLQSQPFELVLMDMQMPELDGYDATRQIRSLGIEVPVIALTAHAMSGDRDKCIAAGCTDYLTKPIDKTQLLWTVASYLAPVPATAPSAPSMISLSADSSEPVPEVAPPGAIRSEFAQDPQMRELIADFVRELPEQVTRLGELVDHQQLEDLRRTVHQLKGAGGGYGFTPITEQAARAEQIIKANRQIAEVRRAVDELIGVLKRVEGFPHVTEPTSEVVVQTVEAE